MLIRRVHKTPSLPPSLPLSLPSLPPVPYLHRPPGKPPALQGLGRFLGGGRVGILDKDLPDGGGGRAGGLEGGREGRGRKMSED